MAEIDRAVEAARELLAGVESRYGPLTSRKMFGGAGLYAQGVIFAVIVDGELLLKADPKGAPALAAAFETAGAARWRYAGKLKPVAMPYWFLPDEAADDPEEAAAWAARSIDAALAAGSAGRRGSTPT